MRRFLARIAAELAYALFGLAVGGVFVAAWWLVWTLLRSL